MCKELKIKPGDIVTHIGMLWEVKKIFGDKITISRTKSNDNIDTYIIDKKNIKKEKVKVLWNTTGFDDVKY